LFLIEWIEGSMPKAFSFAILASTAGVFKNSERGYCSLRDF
jgi:hypothetical protein